MSELDKLKQMKNGDKLDYIWTYYKLHIIGIVCVLLLTGSALNHYIFNPPAEAVLDVTVLTSGGPATEEGKAAMKEALSALVVTDSKSEMVNVDWLQQGNGNDPNLNMANQAVIAGKNEVGALDIFVTDEANFQFMADGGFYQDLEAFAVAEGYELPEGGERITGHYEGEFVAGISVDQFPALVELFPHDSEGYFVGINIRSGRLKNCATALEWMEKE